MGLPPGSRSTHPVFPSGVPKEAASRSRPVAGRFTFIALLKSIRCAPALTGLSAALLGAVVAAFSSCRESGVRSAETPRSKLMLVQSDSVQALGEDMETSIAQRPYHRQSRLEVERPGLEILQGNSLVTEAALLRARNLTLQPFRPKLRLNKHMQAKTHRVRILALLLGVIFLGAQFHFCTDLTAAPSASHICPVCSTAGSVVASQSPRIALVPVTNRLEVAPMVVSESSAVPRDTSPRAPPTL